MYRIYDTQYLRLKKGMKPFPVYLKPMAVISDCDSLKVNSVDIGHGKERAVLEGV